MKWNHLPEPGGIYAQHPVLMERFYYLLAERSAHEASEADRKNKKGMGPQGNIKVRGQ